MKITSLFSLFYLSLTLTIAQNTDCSSLEKKKGLYVQKDGSPYSGTCIEKYENGNTKREISYKNGERKKITSYDEDGNKSEEAMYRPASVPNLTTWYPNGKIKHQVIYSEDKVEAKSYYENGQMKSMRKGNPKHGLQDGSYKEWYVDGNQKLIENYKEGKKHGIRKTWYNNGLVMSEATYEDGEIVGEKQTFKWKDADKVYDLSVQNSVENHSAVSSNGSAVNLSLEYSFNLIEDKLDLIHFGYGSEYELQLIKPIIKKASSEIVANYNSNEITNSRTREKAATEILKIAKAELEEKGVLLSTLAIEKILIEQQN